MSIAAAPVFPDTVENKIVHFKQTIDEAARIYEQLLHKKTGDSLIEISQSFNQLQTGSETFVAKCKNLEKQYNELLHFFSEYENVQAPFLTKGRQKMNILYKKYEKMDIQILEDKRVRWEEKKNKILKEIEEETKRVKGEKEEKLQHKKDQKREKEPLDKPEEKTKTVDAHQKPSDKKNLKSRGQELKEEKKTKTADKRTEVGAEKEDTTQNANDQKKKEIQDEKTKENSNENHVEMDEKNPLFP
ncbi:hypothetical protein MUN89_20780 [Halobacillus salinarum]|uniref:Uncharacterized protein n=2 Tax=Halobacillus salinarum TaxID=2932257 RepID=A0ABY4EQ41_9BACI|nr:hypothetical protein MUN89_20780 [Halobacillus salinarum]